MANSSRSRGRGSGSGSRHPARRPSQRSAAQPHPKSSGSSATSANPGSDPYGTGLSGLTAKKTGFLLYWLSQRPKWFLPLVLLALFVGGFLWRPWGAFLLFALAIILAWFTILSWPVLRISGKVVRIFFSTGLLVYGVVELAHWFATRK
jgi:hypothetical protein